ncbi:hypothetical protein Taro_029605 [Colocasia esculenta]|uniref:Uncharacterized protein n=1 Tax=Colocasia esculenta TaxID=4460 RepID=A0A843VVD0_COLES|nr:hypothetical protein [Colocasia esculenta]
MPVTFRDSGLSSLNRTATLPESEGVQEDDKTLVVPLYRDKLRAHPRAWLTSEPGAPNCRARLGTRRIASRDVAARHDPPIDVSTPVPRATRGTHADDEPKQRQPERDVPGCRDKKSAIERDRPE